MDKQTAQGQSGSKTALWSFWATIAVFAGMVVAVAGGLFEDEIALVEIPPLELREILTEAAQTAHSETVIAVDEVVSKLYEPVYSAVPAYVDFHYSIIGEYTELSAALSGKMSAELQSRLFNNFDANLKKTGAKLDGLFIERYKQALDSGTRERLEGGLDRPGPITNFVLQDSLSRAKTTAPVATAAAGVAGSGAIRTLTATMAKKLLAKTVVKATTKGAAALAGGGTGALACSWGGPLAVLCGVAGAAVAWVATDAAIINVDEALNRDEFEAELRAMIARDQEAKKQFFRDALTRKANMVEDFTLRELHKQTSQ